MILALRAFQQEVDPEVWNARELLLDTAGRHRAKDLRAPPGMALLRLAPSTPEWSPAKPVVPLLREAVARARVPGLEAARERWVERCRSLREHPAGVRGVAGCAWLTNT